MKKLICLILSVIAVHQAIAQSGQPPRWSVALTIVDDAGLPVRDAHTWIAYGVPSSAQHPKDYDKIEGMSDTNGLFTASHDNTHSITLGIHIRKEGYYPTDLVYELGTTYSPSEWNPSLTLVLKHIGKPVPMYAKSLNLGMPVFDKPAGFDLMIGDWVVPYGKGDKKDIIFTAHLDKRDENDVDYKLTVSFANPNDGIQEFHVPPTRFPNQGSALHSPHEAPIGGYQPEWVQTASRRPGKAAETNRDEKQNYFFRVRTILDENGNIKSANYGKIYGDFLNFRYYFNPEPNSRNIEFDPKQNLMKGLNSLEQVNQP